MKLPQISDCQGCGVCCLHMGYPAYMLPRAPLSSEQLDGELALQLLKMGWTQEELLAGHAGEEYWHMLPEGLKTEWQSYVNEYQQSRRSETEAILDGPCFWFDMKTRKCKHHEYRPSVCRDFEVGSKPCIDWRREYHDLIPKNAGD